jgi:hypothetical protein
MQHILEIIHNQAIVYAFNEAKGEMDKEELNAKILSAVILNRAIDIVAHESGVSLMGEIVERYGLMNAIREYHEFYPGIIPDVEDLFMVIVKKEFLAWMESGAMGG